MLECEVLRAPQNRAIRCSHGIHKITPRWADEGDMGWESCLIKQKGEMLRLWNCLIRLPEGRLTKKIFKWDQAHSYPRPREVAAVFSLPDWNIIFRRSLQSNITTVKQNLLKVCREQWKKCICRKPKLRNYIQIILNQKLNQINKEDKGQCVLS